MSALAQILHTPEVNEAPQIGHVQRSVRLNHGQRPVDQLLGTLGPSSCSRRQGPAFCSRAVSSASGTGAGAPEGHSYLDSPGPRPARYATRARPIQPGSPQAQPATARSTRRSTVFRISRNRYRGGVCGRPGRRLRGSGYRGRPCAAPAYSSWSRLLPPRHRGRARDPRQQGASPIRPFSWSALPWMIPCRAGPVGARYRPVTGTESPWNSF